MASAQVELNDQVQNGISGTLNNRTVASMQLIRFHSYPPSNCSTGWAPQTIMSNGTARFIHLGAPGQGSKAGVSYTITNTTELPCAVILAWDAPAKFNPSTSPNKVFGACGPKPLIDAMTWDQIEKLLDKAGSSSAVTYDGICMEATILNNPASKMADLLANFGLVP